MPPIPKTSLEPDILILIRDLSSTVKIINESLQKTYEFVERSTDGWNQPPGMAFLRHDLSKASSQLDGIQQKLKALGIES